MGCTLSRRSDFKPFAVRRRRSCVCWRARSPVIASSTPSGVVGTAPSASTATRGCRSSSKCVTARRASRSTARPSCSRCRSMRRARASARSCGTAIDARCSSWRHACEHADCATVGPDGRRANDPNSRTLRFANFPTLEDKYFHRSGNLITTRVGRKFANLCAKNTTFTGDDNSLSVNDFYQQFFF